MMPDYVAFSTRVLFDLAGAGVTPGRTRPSHCVGPSLSCEGAEKVIRLERLRELSI